MAVESVGLDEAVGRKRFVGPNGEPLALAVIETPLPCDDAVRTLVARLSENARTTPVLVASSSPLFGGVDLLADLPGWVTAVLNPEDWSALPWIAHCMVDRCWDRLEIGRMRSELGASTRVLERLRDQAQVAEQTKSELLANVGHEIRTPMNAILGFTRLALRDPLPPEQQTRLQFVHQAGLRLLRVLDNLLDFSHLAAGRVQLNVKPVHFDAMLRGVVEQVTPAIREKGLAFQFHLEPAIPLWLDADAGRLRRILAELLDNAIKFTEQGMVYVQAVLDEETAETATLRISVTDTGAGVPFDRQGAIFESFSQADGSSTRRVGGMGLGLTICKQLIDLMQGQIGFRSIPGEGSTFWLCVTLPKVSGGDCSGDDPKAALWAVAQTDSAPVLNVPRILLVENDRLIRHAIELYCTRAGYLVEPIGQDDDPSERLRDASYRAILLSLGPKPDEGIARLAKYRALQTLTGSSSIPLVALVPNGTEAARRRCLEAGASDCLACPPILEAVLSLLERVAGPLQEDAAHAFQEPSRADGSGAPDVAWQRVRQGLHRVQAAGRQGDLQGVEQNARDVRGFAERLGLQRLADTMFRVLLAARDGNRRRTAEVLEELRRQGEIPCPDMECAVAGSV